MVQQNPTGHPVPAHPPPPPGFMEYLSRLVQTGSLPPLMAQTPTTPLAPIPEVPPSPTETRSFTRPGRGQGGALTQKLKVSKQITASATKRKSLVDPDVEIQSPSTSDPAEKSSSTKPAKRIKTVKVRGLPRVYYRFLTNP